MGKIHVSDDTSAELQDLIDRLRAETTGRRELLERAYDRLLKIAATIFKEDFPGCAAVMNWKASSARSGFAWWVRWPPFTRKPSTDFSGWCFKSCPRAARHGQATAAG